MKGRSLHAVLLALPFAAGSALLGFGAAGAEGTRAAAAANVPVGRVSGADVMGVLADGSPAPVTVEQETLTFVIPDLSAENGGVNARVTASYTLKNNSGEDMTVSMYLPVGARSAPPAEGAYKVTADGVPLDENEVFLRYTYYGRENETYLCSPERLPQSDYSEEIGRETPVTVYTYAVTAPEGGKFTFTYDANPQKTLVISARDGAAGIKNGRGELYQNLQKGENTVIFYAIGEKPENVSAAAHCGEEALSCTGGVSSDGGTFGGLIDGLYEKAKSAESGLGGTDFYNAAVAMLTGAADRLSARLDETAVLENLMTWYAYELEIPANGTLVNTVEAPFLPAVPPEEDGRQGFTYLLSPGQHWESVEKVVFEIQTPLVLTGSTLDFEPYEGGYRYQKDGLPMGELSFSLARTAQGSTDPHLYGDEPTTLTTALIILGCVVGASAIAVGIVLIVKKRQERARRREEARMERGKAEEGKVDLDPFPAEDGEHREEPPAREDAEPRDGPNKEK